MSTDLETSRINIFLHAENTRIFSTGPKRILPVTLITGFLGAGKTTLMKYILNNKSNLRVAAAINDFASLNIDEDLIRSKNTSNKIVELSNGCVCCQLLGDLETSVWDLLKEGSDVDLDNINYLLIETSGVSDPLRIIKSLDAKFGKMYRARLDSVVTVIDADALRIDMGLATHNHHNHNQHNHDDKEEEKKELLGYGLEVGSAARSQIVNADVLLLNKTDLVEDATLENIEQYVQSLNPEATLYQTKRCVIPLDRILDVSLAPSLIDGGQPQPISHESTAVPFYVSATGGTLRKSEKSEKTRHKDAEHTNNATEKHQHHHHSSEHKNHLEQDRFTNVAITIESQPLDLYKLSHFVRHCLPVGLVRMKGILWLNTHDYERVVIHLSGRNRIGFELDGVFTGPPKSTIAFIGKDLNEKELVAAFHTLVVNDTKETQKTKEIVETDDIDAILLEKQGKETKGEGETVFNYLKQSELFEMDDSCSSSSSYVWFRMTGFGLYGYTVQELKQDVRLDLNQMNIDVCNAVNFSTSTPRGFITYRKRKSQNGNEDVWLCVTDVNIEGNGTVCGNDAVLESIGRKILKVYFKNVTSCKCGS